MTETARPLLTPDECLRLPSPKKNAQGKVLQPGDMLVFTAGQPPIYGRQILYFNDPIFFARAKIPAPGVSSQHQNGVTDSLYKPRFKGLEVTSSTSSNQVPLPSTRQKYEAYFSKQTA